MITTVKLLKILFTLLIWLLLSGAVFAEEAKDVTKAIDFKCENINITKITDGNLATHSGSTNVCISVNGDIHFEGIYIKYNKAPSGGTLNGSDIAQNSFLHEYIPLNGDTEFILEYPEADICDIQVFSEGILPNTVQLWEIGEPETDVLLCATHSDDDQLFFAGLLPYYAVHRNARVRVAYFINHYDTYNRTHELLDGLWHCGVKYYPDISPFPDGYSENVSDTVQYLNSKGFKYSDFIDFQRNLLNKYKPLVVVLHDFKGEYGHGAHMLNTETFVEACEIASNDEFVPEKIYVHLYENNQIKLDIDKPLDEFEGLSAFNVSQQAFGYHKSQHWTWFYKWIYGSDKSRYLSTQITTYNPAYYGLYFSSVGIDINKNDILENIVTYAEREQKIRKINQNILDTWKKMRLQFNSDASEQENNCISNSINRSNSKISHIFIVFLAFIIITAASYRLFKRNR